MAGQGEFNDAEVKRIRPGSGIKKLSDNSSISFFENREYKSSSEKCRSHQTLSFKRNLLDLEFNAAHGDSETKKCTEDLIDLFERKSLVSNATQATSEADTPRKDENVVPEQNKELLEKKSKLAIILSEPQDDLTASVDSGAEDLTKIDEFSFEYESTEEPNEKAEVSFEIDDKFSENNDLGSEFIDIESFGDIIGKRESISDKLDVSHALFTDTISVDGDVVPQDIQLAIDTDTNEVEEDSFMNRIKVLKQSMDEINSMIAIEKDLLRQEKLELENSRSLVPFASSGEGDLGMGIQDPRKVLEEMKLKERRLKMSFQMKQLEEAQKRCSSEMQMISSTASKVDQLNQDMAEFNIEELKYLTVKDNNYSVSYRSVRSPNRSPITSPRRALGSDRKMPGSLLSSVNNLDTTSFEGSLISPIEFTMGDTRLQMQAADSFKLKISQLEAELNSGSFQPSQKIFTERSSGKVTALPIQC